MPDSALTAQPPCAAPCRLEDLPPEWHASAAGATVEHDHSEEWDHGGDDEDAAWEHDEDALIHRSGGSASRTTPGRRPQQRGQRRVQR
jgi:hypothetical protein